VELALPELASVRRDVDEPADLHGAGELGLGSRTAALAARLVAPDRDQDPAGPMGPPTS
jgi:2-phospho-L-lactate guanylyltransferase